MAELSHEDAIRAFGLGFCRSRSLTYPYRMFRHGPLWIMRDDPLREKEGRKHEAVVGDHDPAEVVELLREYGYRTWLCVMHQGNERRADLEGAYKAHKYRLMANEPLFVFPTDQPIPTAMSPAQVIRVNTKHMSKILQQEKVHRRLPAACLVDGESEFRPYVALLNGDPVGWVTSVETIPGCRWVSNLHVKEEHRRQGIGAALMATMLRDDAAFGHRHSVLLASMTGAKLYPTLGYEQRGLLQLFTPPRS